MAEPKTKRKRKPRRLVNLQVDEVSLVDNPAVPEATFVVVKRDEEQAVAEEAQPETVETEMDDVVAEEAVEKADNSVADAYAKAITTLRAVANQMSPAGLHVLGQIMEFAAFEYPDSDFAKSLRKSLDELEELGGEELAKAGRVLSKANFSRIKQASELLTSVIKSTGIEDEEQEKSVDEPPPTEDEVIAKEEQTTEISAMDAAGELLDAREAEAAESLRQQREQQELEAVAALEQLTSHVDTRLGELASSLDGFRSEFNQARGKVEI